MDNGQDYGVRVHGLWSSAWKADMGMELALWVCKHLCVRGRIVHSPQEETLVRPSLRAGGEIQSSGGYNQPRREPAASEDLITLHQRQAWRAGVLYGGWHKGEC